MKRPIEQLGIAEAADYLYAIAGEFKAADEAAADAMREARCLLDVSVRRMFDAYQRNAIVANKQKRTE